MRSILILGSGGLLGSDLKEYFSEKGYKVIGLLREDLDITIAEDLYKTLKRQKPDLIINTAALINVDNCEENPSEAWKVNALGPGNIARAISSAGLKDTVFMQISTSDVFGGGDNKFYTEDDEPHPINEYGRSKLGGEKFTIQEAGAGGIRYFILRSGWIYGNTRKTFVDIAAETLLNGKSFEAISDQYNTPVFTGDMAESIEFLMKNDLEPQKGIFHVSGYKNGEAMPSKRDIALFIANILNKDPKLIKPRSSSKLLRVPRPGNAVLLNTKLPRTFDWKTSLGEYIISKYAR